MPRVQFTLGADISDAEKAFKRLSRKMQKFGRQCEKTGKALTKTLTVPLVAVGTAAFKAANDVDKANKTIARGTGATGKVLNDLQGNWKKLAGQVSQNFDQSAQVLADYNTRLGLTGKALTKLSKQALDAGRMMDEDVNQVVEQSAKAMQDWGVQGKDMSATMDKIFKASQDTGISMSKLSQELYKYGSPMRQMGFGLEETIALMSSFDKAGVNTELVLGSLRQALGRMAKDGVQDTSTALRMIIEDIKNAGSVGEANAIAIEKFGSRAGSDMAAAIREGRFEVDNLVVALNTASGAIDKSNESTKTLGDRWGETKNQIMLALDPLGETMLDVANQKIPALQQKIQGLSDKIVSMSDESKADLLKLAGVLAVGGPMMIAVNATIGVVTTLGTTLLGLASGPAAPFILVAGAIATTVKITAKLQDKLDTVTGKLQSQADQLRDTAAQARAYNRAMAGDDWAAYGMYDGTPTPAEEDYDAVDAEKVVSRQEQRLQRGIYNPKHPKPTPSPPPTSFPSGGGTHDSVVPETPNTFADVGPMFNFGLDSISNNLPQISDWFSQISDRVEYMGMPLEDAVAKIEAMRDCMVPLSDEWKQASDMIEQYQGQLDRVDKKTKEAATKSDLWVNDLSRGLAQGVVNGGRLEDVLSNIGKQLASSMLQKLIMGMFGGGGGDLLGGLFGGARASGGPVSSGTPYLVGEEGPEVFVPDSNGSIIPNGDGTVPGMATNNGKSTPAEVTIVNLLDKSQLDEIATENLAKNREIVVNHFFRDMDERGLTVNALRRG